MNNKKILYFAVFFIILILVIFLCYRIYKKLESNKMSVSDINSKVNINDDLDSINFDDYEEENISLDGTLKISNEGVYKVSGTIDDGNIIINVNGNVKLILDGVNIKNSSGPAIMVENASNVLIYLSEGSINSLEDGVTYKNLDEDVKGVIYSKDNLVFDGDGTLNIKANYKDGIVCKDDLKIVNGVYNIDSMDDAIRGKDSLYIVNGTFNVNSKGDGLKSTNTTDSNKGFILIENGKFNIVSLLDGIQAETKLIIKDGEFDIVTGGGAVNVSTSNSWGRWSSSEDDKSAKGLKACNNIIISGGKFFIDSSDDSVHSNETVGISGGEFSINSGDDGIHADDTIIIDSGNIDIKKSYEGIEASNITINNGNISVVSSDDGINVAGGNDESGMNRPGQNNYKTMSNNKLIINDGLIYVNASGDGLDANGSIYVYGGVINVDGPSESGNGALDYDGEFVMNGGVLFAVGNSGMAQGISDNSKQYNVMLNLNNLYDGGSISLVDGDGVVIETYTPSKSFNSVVISSSRIVKSGSYSIEINGENVGSFTVNSVSTVLGNNMQGGMRGGPGRSQGPREEIRR